MYWARIELCTMWRVEAAAALAGIDREGLEARKGAALDIRIFEHDLRRFAA